MSIVPQYLEPLKIDLLTVYRSRGIRLTTAVIPVDRRASCFRPDKNRNKGNTAKGWSDRDQQPECDGRNDFFFCIDTDKDGQQQ